MKVVRIPPELYQERGVPAPLARAAQVLNEALAIYPDLVRSLLDKSYLLDKPEAERFLAHPSIVVRGTDEGDALSALGLIAGIVNSGPFRLSVFEEDDGSWSGFGVVTAE